MAWIAAAGGVDANFPAFRESAASAIITRHMQLGDFILQFIIEAFAGLVGDRLFRGVWQIGRGIGRFWKGGSEDRKSRRPPVDASSPENVNRRARSGEQ